MHHWVSNRPGVCLSLLCDPFHEGPSEERPSSQKEYTPQLYECPLGTGQLLPTAGELSEPVAACTWVGTWCFCCPYAKPSSIGTWAAAGSILEGVGVNHAVFACMLLGAGRTRRGAWTWGRRGGLRRKVKWLTGKKQSWIIQAKWGCRRMKDQSEKTHTQKLKGKETAS